MSHARMCHTSTLLSNGQTLVAGGTKNLTGGSLASAELFTPSTRKFVATAGPLMVARYEHQAVLLNNGTVLVMGGFTGDSLKDVTNSAELYNPAAGGSFSLTGVMSVARGSLAATLLDGGGVIVTGGYDASGPVNSAELYSPTTGSFSLLPMTMTTPRADHTATLLNNGMVLIVGGYSTLVDGEGANALSSAELYNPSNNTFTATGSMLKPRAEHVATLLNDGRVLIAGGIDNSGKRAGERRGIQSGHWLVRHKRRLNERWQRGPQHRNAVRRASAGRRRRRWKWSGGYVGNLRPQPEHLYLCNQIDDGKALANRVQLLGGECALNSVTKKR